MDRPHPRTVAAATAQLGVLSLLTGAYYKSTIPENPPGDGFAAGLVGLFVLLCPAMGVLTLVEAVLLVLVTRFWEPTEVPRQLLTAGAVAGSLSIVLIPVPMLVTRAASMLLPRPVTWVSVSDSCSFRSVSGVPCSV